MRPDSPLPLRTRGLSPGLLAAAEAYASHLVKARISHPNGAAVISLKTDSPHLRKFFTQNWAQADLSEPVDAEIIALRGDSAHYGLDSSLDGVRSYYRNQQKILFLAHEAYANLKITVRGLCSQLAVPDVLWMHGCSLAIDMGAGDEGLMLLGRSGGGKTTITATLRQMLGKNKVRVINDDWGAVSMSDGRCMYTGENALHMKYISVNAHDPTICPSPSSFPSEHFSADPTDPLPRMLIKRSRVFGPEGIADSCQLAAIVLLRRAAGIRPGIGSLDNDAVRTIEEGEYSEYYDSTEQFFNGSLFTAEARDLARHRSLYGDLLNLIKVVELGNVELPETVAGKLLRYMVSTKQGTTVRQASSRESLMKSDI